MNIGHLRYGEAALLLLTAHLASALLQHTLSRRLQPGLGRLVFALPSLALNLGTPLLFPHPTYIITRILTFFTIAWLATFKLLQHACNRGPLSDPRLGTVQWMLALLLPITPTLAASPERRGRLAEDVSGAALARKWSAKVAMLGVIVWALQYNLPVLVASFCYGMALYALLSLVMDGPGALVTALVGMHVSPHFDKPFTATGVATFWSKRWDLAAGNALRQLVYEPILEGQMVAGRGRARAHRDASVWRQLVASTASFLTSGLVHEAACWYIVGRPAGGPVLAFFLVQMPAIIVEKLILSALHKRGITVPRPLLTAWVLVFELLASQYLFWTPLIEMGVVPGALQSLKGSYDQGLAGLRQVRASLATESRSFGL